MAEEEADKTEEGGGGGSKMLVIILVVLNLVSMGGFGAYVLLGGSQQPAPAAAAEEAEAGADPSQDAPAEGEEGDPAKAKEPAAPEGVLGPMVELGTFMINLNSMGDPRYLKAVLKAEVSSEETGEEIKKREPQLRDMIISYLSSLTIKDTYGAKAKAQIRDNIERRVNQVLVSGEVRRVFFTDFMTQ